MDLNRKSAHKENSKDWWDEKYKSFTSGFLYSKEPSKFLTAYFDLLPKNAKVLEIAAGEGRNAVMLAAKGCDVTTIDFSPAAGERSAELQRESGVKWTAKTSDLDFYLPELLTFDAIVSVDFKPSLGLIKNLGRGLKQNGFLLMEAFLIAASRDYQNIEPFECFKPNELLHQFVPSQQATFQILHYSELGDTKWGDKVFMIAKKAQLF